MYFTQTDENWKNEIMTHPKDQNYPDTLGEWGCLVTAVSNVLYQRGIFTNPKVLNEIIIRNKGYLYLFDPDTPKEQASFLRFGVLEKLYNFKKTTYNQNKYLAYGINNYYIGFYKVFYNGRFYTHFVNIIEDKGDTKIIFDVYRGEIKELNNEDFIKIYKLEFFE